ncbi:MAG: HPr kinase/phosphorylase [Syntrophus sp. SKADARSKE-3]|nr:HPr kinase/phosphorylase [Syntrophus sp. SKADARSKE-3]
MIVAEAAGRVVMKYLALNSIISSSEKGLEIFYLIAPEGLKKKVKAPSLHHYEMGKIPRFRSLVIISPQILYKINQMDPSSALDIFHGFAKRQVLAVLFTDCSMPPSHWVNFAKEMSVSLGVSRLDSHLLESRLKGLIREKWEGIRQCHGTLIAVNGAGVLLMGEAGAGKTTLAMALMERGHFVAADDAVILKRQSSHFLTGCSHKSVRGLVYLRDGGIRALALQSGFTGTEDTPVRLVVELVPEMSCGEPRMSHREIKPVMGVPIPHIVMNHCYNMESMAARIVEAVNGNK